MINPKSKYYQFPNEAPRAKARGFLPACPSGEIPTDSIRGLKAAVLKHRDKSLPASAADRNLFGSIGIYWDLGINWYYWDLVIGI